MSTRLLVFSAPANLRSDIDRLLGEFSASIKWSPQPLLRGHYQTSTDLNINDSQRSALASQLAKVVNIRFELEQLPASGQVGESYLYVPGLGIQRRMLDEIGNQLVTSVQIEAVLAEVSQNPARAASSLRKLLGQALDDELEPFRQSGIGVVLLHRAG